MFDDVRVAIARRDIASLSREKTIVLALAIQIFIAAFSSFLVVGLTSLYDPGSVESGELTFGVSGDARDELDEAARSAGVGTEHYPTREAALDAFRRGEVVGVFHAESVDRRTSVTVTVPDSSVQSTLAVVKAQDALEALERDERTRRATHLETQPVPLPPEADASSYFGFTYTVLVPLLLFLPPFISGSVTVDVLTEEIERGTLELLRVAPVSLTDIFDGKALGMAILAPAQALLWIALLVVNGITVTNVLPLLALVSAVALLVVVLGAVLGLLLAQRRQAQLLYSIIALGLFGLAALLPEHPATVAAKLAVGSETTVSTATVLGLSVLAVVLYAAARSYVGTIDPERY
ncbi:ABC transporter permease [Halapricum hydrolyticum]|uniref:ABC transporter permease n=1 Tax=Halapricum hydrolyticum TaxID=2979991 RepID=A0AAE3I9T4_9EURY|nr:ABC transporter permease [Halapricum hydrolyticum]MCU4717386.1 ABC transporter permease [Halapricum hydrolyticum]MCU4726550.1 ABC transporter permease [Halapricum hydrolyticum]